MVLLKSTVCLLLIIAFADANSIKPTCSSNCTSDKTREGTQVNFFCQIQSTGGNKPALTWKWKLLKAEVQNVPAQEQLGSIIKRDFYMVVSRPVPALSCSDGEGGTCELKSCNILYSPKLVVTIPPLLASPGENITCTSDGHPKPDSFKWQESVDGSWTDVPGANDKTFTAELKDGATYTELRCVASNDLGSGISVPVFVTKDAALIRNVIIGVVVAVVVIAIIVVGIMQFKCPDVLPWN